MVDFGFDFVEGFEENFVVFDFVFVFDDVVFDVLDFVLDEVQIVDFFQDAFVFVDGAAAHDSARVEFVAVEIDAADFELFVVGEFPGDFAGVADEGVSEDELHCLLELGVEVDEVQSQVRFVVGGVFDLLFFFV